MFETLTGERCQLQYRGYYLLFRSLSRTATSHQTYSRSIPSAWLIPLSQIILGLIRYAFVPGLPFFWDDVPQNAWLAHASLLDIWTSTVVGLNYFRPLAFSAWKLITLIQGAFDPTTFHWLNLLLHIFNATLVGWIAYGLAVKRRTWTGLAAATLFTLFPFSFQAIAPVSSVMHPLSTAYILTAVLIMLRLPSTSLAAQRWLKAASVISAGVAVLAHESGAVACVLITWTALIFRQPHSLKRIARDTWPYWLAGLAGFLIWRAVPRLTDPLPIGDAFTHWESRLQNSVWFLQGLAPLFTPLAGQAKSLLSIGNDLVTVTLIGLSGVIIWLVLVRWDKRSVWALGWFVIAAIPAVWLLDFNYVIESPRLMYLASAGTALLWAMPLSLDMTAFRGSIYVRRTWPVVVSALVVTSSLWGWRYVGRRADLYSLLGQSVAQLHNVSQDDLACSHTDQPHVVVNFPEWYFVHDGEYLLGHDGIKSIPEAGSLDDLMQANVAHTTTASAPHSSLFLAVTLPDIQRDNTPFKPIGSPQTHDSLPGLLRPSHGAIVNVGDDDTLHFVQAGCFIAPQSVQSPAAVFHNQIELMRATLKLNEFNPRLAMLTLDWHMRAVETSDITVFVQVLSATSRVVAQADGYPIGGILPMRVWQAGDTWRDIRPLSLPDAALTGSYTVIVGLYRTSDGVRLPVVNAASGRVSDNALVVATWALPEQTPT